MDAEKLEFPDASFDVVMAQYVVTTVPHPEATLDEFARVLKPGGQIILVSRVGAELGLRRSLEKCSRQRRASSGGVQLAVRALHHLGRGQRDGSLDRAPRGAAVRPLLVRFDSERTSARVG